MLKLSEFRVSHERNNSFAVDIPSLELGGGTVHGLIGHNGSGKTTLALALAGMIPELIPGGVEGEITINGESLQSLTLRERLGKVGYSFQDAESQILFGTVREVLAVDERTSSTMSSAIDAIGARHLLDRFPDELSGGEAQRVALLTALRRNPSVVVFDEATSALDPGARRDFAKFIDGLYSEDRIAVLLGQRRDQLEPYCDSLHGLRLGKLVSVGDVEPQITTPVALGEFNPEFPRVQSGLHITDLYTQRKGHHEFVLGPCSLNVSPGEAVAILGANGCGKTTLLLALAGLLRVRKGEVQWGGKRLNFRQWHSHPHPVSFVPQSPLHRIIGSSIAEELEIHLGWKSGTSEMAGWEKLMRRFIYLQAERDPLELSYGQQRFLTLLESFLAAQPVLLIDEPELGLDPQALAQIEDWLRSTRQGRTRTVLFSTHNLQLAAATADRCLLMQNGKIIDENASRDVDELERWYFGAHDQNAF